MKFQLVLLSVLALLALVVGSSEEVDKESTTPQAPTPSPDFDCPNLEEGFYPHQSDCSKYYHCSNGLAWLLECADNLYFNPEINQCDWQQNVECEFDDVTPDPAVRGASIIEPAPWFNCTNKPNGAYPHEEDCDKYYDCYNGLAHLGICTEYMLFDLTYGGCNYAQDVYCDDRFRPTNVPTTTRRTTTTTRPPGFSTDAPFICPEPEGLFPDPENCAAYYQCFGGNHWHMYCNAPLFFNEVLRVCDYLPNVDCGNRPIIP